MIKAALLLLVAVGVGWGQISPKPGNSPTGAAGGDLSGTYPNPTVAKVNNTTFTTNATANQVPLTTAAAVTAWTGIPSCLDSAGQHLNFNTTTHAFSCGTSGGVDLSGVPAGSVLSKQGGVVAGSANHTFIASTAAPSAPSVSVTHCSLSGTSYGYKTAFHFPTGDSNVSPETQVSCDATLDGTHYPIITAPSCSSSNESVDIFVSTAGGNVANTGWIANVACGGTYNHQGANGGNYGLPVADGTGGLVTSGVAVFGDDVNVPNWNQSIFDGASLVVNNSNPSNISHLAIINNSSGGSFSGGYLSFVTYRGTPSAPEALQNGDDIMDLDLWPYDGQRWDDAPVTLRAFVDGSVTPGAGVPIAVSLESSGAGFANHAARLRANGNFELYANAFSAASVGLGFNTPGVLEINDGTPGQLATISALGVVHTPASSSEPCTAGQFSADTNYYDECVSTNLHKSIPLLPFHTAFAAIATSGSASDLGAGTVSTARLPDPFTATNCSSAASPAVCASAAAGSVAIPTGTNPTLVVNTTKVTANSQIMLQSDDSLGTKLGVTCNSTLASLVAGIAVTARTAATSFTITFNGVLATNPLCVSYTITN